MLKLHPRQQQLKNRQKRDMARYRLLMGNINYLRNRQDSHLRTEQIYELEKIARNVLDYWDDLFMRRIAIGLRVVKSERDEVIKKYFKWGKK